MSESQRPSSEEAAHDVLAAEAFAMPGADPSLHHGPVVLPEDPTGIAEPHDVLAAEQFPMPAVPAPRTGVFPRPEKASHTVGIVAAAAGLLLLLARRLRRRARRDG
jgi:hypothetical protein